MRSISRSTRSRLRGATAPAAILLGLLATPAFAQTVPNSTVPGQDTPPRTASSSDTGTANPQAQTSLQGDQSSRTGDQATEGDVVVTGTLFRRTNTETPSPVTVVTADQLNARGINTVAEAVQRLSANGSGALPNSFSANGAFASGASAASLRGLTTDSTLVLFDGLRAAYYPLADDGTRNFVDINSIPEAIVDRVEVLKDGASSTYGADAVAGVINIITKKQITGLHLNGSAGISMRGDTGERRVDATWGVGNVDDNGYNFYVSAEYQKDDALFSRDRGYPYNTNDLSHLCTTTSAGTQACRTNSVVFGINYDGVPTAGTTLVPIARPYNATNTAAVAGGVYSLLNPGAGCRNLNPITLTPAQVTAIGAYSPNECQQDSRYLFSVINPDQQRLGLSARFTAKLGENSTAYLMGNWYESDVFYTGTPQAIRANSPAGGALFNGGTFTTASIALPIYVCPRNGASATFVNNTPTVPGCAAATPGATLNPNNPYAGLGETARVLYQLSDVPLSNERLVDSFRGAAGINGSFGDGWNYSLEGVGMVEKLKATYKGYIYAQHLLDVVADGSYNFINPSQNSQAVRDYLAPTDIDRSQSKLYEVHADLSKALFRLPGGDVQLGVGVSYRHESVTSPSANPTIAGQPTQTYFTINRFGTSGARNVKSAYFELQAPVVRQFEINASGRYDDYSSGQHNFSPKIGAKFTPIKQLAIRGTFSKGFRIPSFAEAYGLPTTGYITQTPPANYQALCATPKPAYCTAQYSLGLTSVGNPNLKPEKSTNFTAGVIFEPIRNVSFTVDYYNIYKKDLITGADYSPQIAAYYGNTAGTTLTNGITGITQDTTGFSALAAGQAPYPLLSTIEYGFINADSAKSTGIDFGLETKVNITPSIKWTSSLDANYVIELSETIGGVKQRYEDSLGQYQITAASGTPQWRGSWQNTLDFGKVALTLTSYYTAGYSEGAADDGNTPDGQTCTNTGSFTEYRDNSATAFNEGTVVVRCRVHHFIDNDLTLNIRVNDKFSVYSNVLNLFDVKPPYDPSTYGAYQYNPAWANAGIIGRYFRVGARVNF